MVEEELIQVFGAREHNLKNIDVTIPRNKVVVITGLSGSGKSSLAFDTIYAEGQRRYIESFAAYARQFLGGMERPDVDKITGLSPVISIEQKTTSRNPRSTVGTITEIYDFLRLLYARTADAYSYNTGELMVRYSDDQIINLILEKYDGKKLIMLGPVIKGRKGHYRELFEQVRKSGFTKVRVDGEVKDITYGMKLDRYKIHDIEIVVDRIEVNAENKTRINDALKTCMRYGKGTMMVQDYDTNKVQFFSRMLMCPTTGISYDDPAPNLFSFNSPYGACHKCNGLGEISEIDIKKIIPNPQQSIKRGGLAPLGEYKNSWIFAQLEAIGEKFGFKLDTPLEELTEDAIDAILYGTEEVLKVKGQYEGGLSYAVSFDGIVNFISNQFEEGVNESTKRWAESFMNKVECPECHGARLRKEALYFKLDGKNIAELSRLDINEFFTTINGLGKKLSKRQLTIGKEVLKEIADRTNFLLDIGLDYLRLNMSSKTLSGGEAQRIRLATQIGSQLVGVLYILDEPSIGLHQRDNTKLIKALQNLRDSGNSVIVVEHDKEMMEAADYILDIGPGAGVHGGRVVASGTYADILKSDSSTSQYLNNIKSIPVPATRREGNGKFLTLKGATGHNLQNVDLKLPLGKFICVSGVSGSGKSSLINETLYPILAKHFYDAGKKPLPYKKIEGIENIDKVIDIDQTPIGRTPRSNPATYTGVFTDIRTLFANLPEAKIRGYLPGRFSFNVKGGRCETCKGGGVKVIEMNFLPDVEVLCETCQGKRYNRETLEVRFKGKSISDVLDMTIEQAVEFFEAIPSILQKIRTLNDVGLGYITLGQQSTTLSGGEAQRVKLATELSKRDTGQTLYLLDEPTTGLHFEDIRILLEVLDKLVNRGNTVLVIEHNMDIIKVADHIIDIGPDGGVKGGHIVAEGTPEEIVKKNKGFTAPYLKKELDVMPVVAAPAKAKKESQITMKVFGLIGYPLTHSFSKKYFTEKFDKLGLEGYSYELFPLSTIDDLPQLIADNPNLVGLNVTIPYKESVIPFLSGLDETAKVVGAVNTILITPSPTLPLKGEGVNSPPNVGGVPRSGEGVQLIGYNTDVLGFSQSLKPLLHPHHERALILGSGGAAKAVAHVLKGLGIQYYFVSREKKNGPNYLTYSELNEGVFNACKLIVNTTPVGMYPNVEDAPALPYQFFTPQHLAYDLIYNPTNTLFMKQAAQQGAHTVNGLNMLYMQAEAAWKIWEG